MNKPVYLGLRISNLSKAVMYECQYYYEKKVKKQKLVIWNDIYNDIAEDV